MRHKNEAARIVARRRTEPVAPLFERHAPIFLHGFNRILFILICILAIALLLLDIFSDVRLRLLETGQCKRTIDLFRHLKRIFLVILKLHFHQIARRDQRLLLFELVEETAINLHEILHKLLFGKILQLQRLDGIAEKAPRALENRVRIAFEIDELGIREHLEQRLNTSGVRRILAEELLSVRVPQRDLDQFEKLLLEDAPLLFGDRIEQQITLGIIQPMFGKKPEVVVAVRHHAGERELLLLRQIDLQLHVVGWTMIRHEKRHVLLEERLSPHHEMRENGLIRSGESEMAVAGEDVVDESRPAAPMSEDEQRFHLDRLVSKFAETFFFKRTCQIEQAAEHLRQSKLVPISLVNGLPCRNLPKGVNVCTNQCRDRQLAEFYQSHLISSI